MASTSFYNKMHTFEHFNWPVSLLHIILRKTNTFLCFPVFYLQVNFLQCGRLGVHIHDFFGEGSF